MAKALLVVATNPATRDDDADFNAWYTDTHLDDVVALEGFATAKRYVLSDVRPTPGSDPSPFRYLAIYELETDDVASAAANLQAALADGRMRRSDTLGEVRSADFYIPIAGAERP